MEKIFIEKLKENQKTNKGLHFSDAVFHLLNPQMFLIYSKKCLFANENPFLFYSPSFCTTKIYTFSFNLSEDLFLAT